MSDPLPDRPAGLQTVHVWQLDVEDDQVRVHLTQHGQSPDSVLDDGYAEPLALEILLER